MGKSNKKSKQSASSAAKCTCDHPFTCTCGNRPERPSKGHKWDPDAQAWGGKGHKQKGASGQTASASESAKTTAVGKTQVAQWQRLPSQLLTEVCQRQKRPRPKFKNIEKAKGNVYKYRCIAPDTKDSDKDLFFVPSHAVSNEEQAKEEAALLALLSLTPDLPHERKLPDPYKTTWLHAIAAQKNNKSTDGSKKKKVDDSSKKPTNSPNRNNTASSKTASSSGAVASTSLGLATSYTSLAEKRKQQEEKRRLRNSRIRHHEAVRMANQNHPVFMSAQIRKQIENILRGDRTSLLQEGDEDGEDEDPAEDLDDVEAYVRQRLHSEGFTWRQARTAYQELPQARKSAASSNEDEWDKVYEECLQWLLVHLNEDQLPEGFDPRGRTLHVVVPVQKKRIDDTNNGTDQLNPDSTVSSLASKYGISVQEATVVQKRALKEKVAFEEALWMSLQTAANVTLEDQSTAHSDDSERNKEILNDELEALQAIFASECQVVVADERATVLIHLEDGELSLKVDVQCGVYPAVYPKSVLLSGSWPSSETGAPFHVELLKFIASLGLGEPMIFEIHGQVQALLQSMADGELSLVSLLSPETPKVNQKIPLSESIRTNEDDRPERKKSRPVVTRRPRERGLFWNTPPRITPPATAFPKIDKAMEAARKSLPTAAARTEFLSVLKKADQTGRVLLVEGETGCGKTTQIPQFLLEEFPNEAKIVVAQPRRLAATGVAARVATERGENRPGVGSVGYVVRGDSAMSKSTRLVFCTTGVLLRQLQSEGALDCINTIVVDEVHERHLDTDVLLGLLKQSLKTHQHLRVILMSATLDADKFAAYWGNNTPRIHIPGRTFPVKDYMLEDVLSLTGYIPPKKRKGKKGFSSFARRKDSSPWADSEKSGEEPEDDTGNTSESNRTSANASSSNHGIPIEELVARVDETSVDYDLLARLVIYLVANKAPADDGSILVFLSGAPEINNALETIKRYTRELPLLLLPLHGGLQPKEQNFVFRPAPFGSTKVILSTNVAETSVTIPDCTIVIDTAREKQSSYDPSNRMPLLVEQFISTASSKQRKGRAGRCHEGTCYKLISRATFAKLKQHGEPEIRRCALDQTLLSLLFMGVETGSGSFMETLLDPPSKESLEAAAFSLRQIGAVESVDTEGGLAITSLGMHLAGIPAPPIVGKMLVMGSILGCRKAAIAMAAGMSMGRSPFLRIDSPRRKKLDVDEKESLEQMKQQRIIEERSNLFKTVGNSDHALLAAVFMKWSDTGTGSGLRKRLCDSLNLSFNGMRDMTQLVNQLDSSLAAAGYVASEESDRNTASWRIIRACAVSAMAPGQLVKVRRPATTYQETAEGAKEKEGEARELKFFIKTDNMNETKGRDVENRSEERVFVHPSSANFGTGSYSCPWLVYHSLVRTSKAFLRDVTESSAYCLLLFGGELEVQAAKGVIVIDNWVQLSANARIGSLIGGLRKKVDELLMRKVSDPSFELADTPEMKLIVKLIRTDGLGT